MRLLPPPPCATRPALAPLAFALLAFAHGARPLPAQPSLRRFAADSSWEYRWVTGSDPRVELFIEPRQLTVVQRTLVVLDAGTREVHLLEAATGRPIRRIQANGTGPGEFTRPSLLAGTPDGFAILDQATARMTAFTLGGRVAWDLLVPDAARLAGTCIAANDRLLLSYRRPQASLVAVDTAGRPLSGRGGDAAIPWRAERPIGPDFALEHHVSPAGADGRCALVPLFGGEWALVSPAARAAVVHAYAEPGDLPRIRQTRRILERTATHVIVEGAEIASTRPVAAGAMRRGDTVVIVATPARTPNRRVLDYYEGATGRYLHSRRLPALFAAVTMGPDGTLYASHIGERTQVVVALRPVARVSRSPRPANTLEPQPPRRRGPDRALR